MTAFTKAISIDKVEVEMLEKGGELSNHSASFEVVKTITSEQEDAKKQNINGENRTSSEQQVTPMSALGIVLENNIFIPNHEFESLRTQRHLRARR